MQHFAVQHLIERRIRFCMYSPIGYPISTSDSGQQLFVNAKFVITKGLLTNVSAWDRMTGSVTIHRALRPMALPTRLRPAARCAATPRVSKRMMRRRPSRSAKPGATVDVGSVEKWVAEQEGFEPSIRGCRIHTFQACAFDHSATAPHALSGEGVPLAMN